MAKTIQSNEVIVDNHLQNAIDQGEKYLKVSKDINDQIKKNAEELKKFLKMVEGKTAKDFNKITKAARESGKAFKENNAILKERRRLQERLKQATSTQIQQNVELKVQLQQQNKINKQLVLENSKIVGVYSAQSAKLNRLRKEYKNLALSEGETSKEAKKLDL